MNQISWIVIQRAFIKSSYKIKKKALVKYNIRWETEWPLLKKFNFVEVKKLRTDYQYSISRR